MRPRVAPDSHARNRRIPPSLVLERTEPPVRRPRLRRCSPAFMALLAVREALSLVALAQDLAMPGRDRAWESTKTPWTMYRGLSPILACEGRTT